ncbi:MAG: hypothetical protein M1813_008115 [Trichoglossum hirsutum]|nr:MAG: hypothetical protein M1813_008115 [Trichoglossum hirsutum]
MSERPDSNPSSAKPPKLRRLPKYARVQKRPLLHPPVPSIHSGRNTQKVVYISSNTAFIPAVKRVRKFLDAIDNREIAKANLSGKGKGKTSQIGGKGKLEPEEVCLKATARAIEKALNLAIFFQSQGDCRVRIRTGSVGVVDDIIEVKKPTVQGETQKTATNRQELSLKRKRSESDAEDNDVRFDRTMTETSGAEPKDAEIKHEELPETQIRKTSVVEVLISLR